MSTKNSELVDQNEIGRKGQTKSATASAFTKLTTKRHFFCEFVNSSMSSSPGQRIPQITKTIQNWWILMDWPKSQDEECHSLSFHQINNKNTVFFVNS